MTASDLIRLGDRRETPVYWSAAEPDVTAWRTADVHHRCPRCRTPIAAGGWMAVLDTAPATLVCDGWVEH